MARTAGSSWMLLGGLLGLVLLQPGGCGGTAPGALPPRVDAAMNAMIGDLWPAVLAPALSRARADADALAAAAEGWAADSGSEAARAAAQDAWREALRSWQVVEVMQIGPLGSATVGAEALRDEVYSWPTLNRCRVDQETVEAVWDAADFFEVNLVNTFGLDALETVLFAEPGAHDCPSQVNLDAAWDALGTAGVQQRRADFAVALADHVVQVIDRMEDRWSGGFADQFATAGESASPYGSREAAIDEIYAAMFYVYVQTRDRKLGGPLGLWDCGLSSCLDEVETTWAGGSNAWIAANLVGLRALFTGNEGGGMEELLRALGHDDVAEAMLAALDRADAAAAALTVPVDVAATTDPDAAIALHGAIGEVTDLLKGDIRTLLVLTPPQEGGGDND